jgi:hypothetical protein
MSLGIGIPSSDPCWLPCKDGLTHQTFHFPRGWLCVPTQPIVGHCSNFDMSILKSVQVWMKISSTTNQQI